MKKTARFLRPLLFLAIILLAGFLSPKNAYAKLSDCTADIDTHLMNINSSGVNVVFNITNTDNNNGRMIWIKITVPPSASLTIEGYGNSQSFTGFDAGVNSPIGLGATIDVGGTTTPSVDWIVEGSDDSGGADPTPCNGNLGTQIIDPSSYRPPQISDVTVSNVTDTSVTLSFTTNLDATCELDYGVQGQAQDQKQNESSASTTHSFNLSSLTANTSYGFTIKAVNDNGEADGNGNFTTAATPYATLPPQIINTTTTTTTVKTLTPTPSPTPTWPS